ncbi:MAG: DUF4271 domain-containing protein [Bacteroidales bacterium]
MTQNPRQAVESDWLYGSFAIILFMIVLLRIFYPLQISRLIRSAIFPGKGQADTRVFEFRTDTFSLLFLIIYSTSFGLLAVSSLAGFRWLPAFLPGDLARLFFLFSGGFLLVMLFKLLMIRFTSSVFRTQKAGLAYQDHMLISAFVTSALIIPFVVMNAFSASPGFLIGAFLIIAALAVIRLARVFPLGFTVESFSYVHFILYFCTLEILPLLFIGKIILDLMM